MSYREENEQVVLTISRTDYNTIIFALGHYAADAALVGRDLRPHLERLNRINEGNPHFTPYRFAGEKPR